MKRKSLSKRTRFEVLKRDKFTCRYCGAKAPDVLIRVDHVIAVADGGDNSMLNLVAACQDCNSGKSCIPLSDSSAIEVKRAEADRMQEKREQLQQMAQWHKELMGAEKEFADSLAESWHALTSDCGFGLNEKGKSTLAKWAKRFGIEILSAAMQEVASEMPKRKCKSEEVEAYWWSIEKKCVIKKMVIENPTEAKLRYIAGIAWNRFGREKWKSLVDLRQLHEAGWPVQHLEHSVKSANSWSQFLQPFLDTGGNAG